MIPFKVGLTICIQMKIKELFPEEYNEKFKILQEKKLLENSFRKIITFLFNTKRKLIIKLYNLKKLKLINLLKKSNIKSDVLFGST